MKIRTIHKIQKNFLEFFAVDHCILKCKHCANFSPYNDPHIQQPDAFIQHLRLLNEAMHVKQFRFLGGEPLLNKKLPDFIRAVKDLKFADRIEVCTNGLLLNKFSDELYKLIDRLSISLYPDNNYKNFSEDSESIRRIAERKRDEFKFELILTPWKKWRYLYLDFPNKDQLLVNKIYNACCRTHYYFRDGCHTIYNGYYYKCSVPVFLKKYLANKFGSQESIPDYHIIDGIPLIGKDLFNRLKSYIKSKSPLKSCDYCLGSSGKYISIEQIDMDKLTNSSPKLIPDIKEVLNSNRLSCLSIILPIYKRIAFKRMGLL